MPDGIASSEKLHSEALPKIEPHHSVAPTYAGKGDTQQLSLKNLVFASIADLLFSGEGKLPQSAEEQFFYDAYVSLPEIPQHWQALLEETLQQASHQGEAVILQLAHHYQLHWLELLALVLAMAVEQDAMAGRAIAYVQAPLGTSRPTLGLLESAFARFLDGETAHSDGTNHMAATLLSGKAMELGLLQTVNGAAPLPEQAIMIPQAVVMALLGNWQAIPGTGFYSAAQSIYLPQSINDEAQRQARALIMSPRRALVVRSTFLREADTVVDIMAGQLQRVPLFIQSGAVDTPCLGLLCVIADLLPVLRLKLSVNEQQTLPALNGYDGPILATAEPDGQISSDSYSVMNWLLPVPKQEERHVLWSQYIDNSQLARSLAREHLHSAGRIAALSDIAMREAELHQRHSQNKDDIHRAAWLNSNDQLASLAQAIPEKIPDAALVLSPTTHHDLEMLLHRCRNREALVDELGVSLTTRYKPGVRGLFIGPSGTGKTLAAAWLATRLTMPLYRVDLASVISKYIGETEKNLATLLARTERADVILLFDEADSLFGKRTDIKDANDRYANTQTNYLLQRIESYQGIVLLTSNNRSRFDSAFTRRIDMIIEFPSPGPQERRELWYSHLGTQHGLNAAQVNQLSATLDLCGGHIRNAVLSAAVLAQKDQRHIEYADVLEGLKIEYKKLGKKLPMELSKGKP